MSNRGSSGRFFFIYKTMTETRLKSNLSKAAKNSRKFLSQRKLNFKADEGANQLSIPAKKFQSFLEFSNIFLIFLSHCESNYFLWNFSENKSGQSRNSSFSLALWRKSVFNALLRSFSMKNQVKLGEGFLILLSHYN